MIEPNALAQIMEQLRCLHGDPGIGSLAGFDALVLPPKRKHSLPLTLMPSGGPPIQLFVASLLDPQAR